MAKDEFFTKENTIAVLASFARKDYRVTTYVENSQTVQKFTVKKQARAHLLSTGFVPVTGFVLEEKLSPLTMQKIVVIVTMNSSNVKTGNMAQIWILCVELSPPQAHKTGSDESVCGDCQHRVNNTCYVTLHHGPAAVWRQFKMDKYPRFNGNYKIFENRQVRFGAYGDPALISKDIVFAIVENCKGHTGYTHQWDKPFASQYNAVFMASTDTPGQLPIANENGWSTFMAIPADYGISQLPVKASFCPAGLNDNIHCIDCGMCNGSSDRIRNKLIIAHGIKAKDYQFAA